MAIAHSIALKENPVAGYERYLWPLYHGRGDFFGYQDDDRAMGGFWSSSFKVRARENDLLDFFYNGIGRGVEARGYGMELLHEGMIYEMNLVVPPDQLSVSLDPVFNKAWMRADYDADNVAERSTTLENAKSQARFGVKETVLGGGQLNSLSVADQAVQTLLDARGFPIPSFDRGSSRSRGEPYLEIFTRGYIYTLTWLTFNQTADTSTQNVSGEIADVFASAPYVTAIVTEGNSTIVSKVYDADRRMLDIGFDISRLGDKNNNRWILYMSAGRVLHFVQAAPIVPAV